MPGIKTAVTLNDQMTAGFLRMYDAIKRTCKGFDSLQKISSRAVDTNNLKSAEVRLKGAATATSRLKISTQEAGEAIRAEAEKASELRYELGRAADQQEMFNQKIREGQSAANSLKSAVLGVVGGLGALAAVKKLVGLSDEMALTKARLDLMNDGLQTTAELQDMIYQAAQRSRGSYQVAADAVSKMGLMAGEAFNSNAELVAFVEQLNKQFALAGTEQAGIAAATTQLTQALGSGVLRGDELNSIFEQAPTIIQTIADYLDVPIGQIRSMAAEGLITASTVKNAMLSAAAETNAKFESMPWTWGQVGIRVMNQLLKASQPLLNLINKIANNWEKLEPIIMGVVTVIGVYLGYMAAVKVAQLAHNVVQGISAVLAYANAKAHLTAGTAFYNETLATHSATAAQYGFNAALLACPITWIVVAIIAAITAITALVRHFDIFGAKSTSVMGTVVGLVFVAGAAIRNFGVFVLNVAHMIHAAVTGLCNNIRAAFSMAINGVIGFFYNLLSVAMSVIASIANALNALPFVSIDVSGLSAAAGNYAQKSADAYARAGAAKDTIAGGVTKQMRLERQAQMKQKGTTNFYTDYTSAFQTGAAKVGGFTGGGYDMSTLGGAVDEIAANTAGGGGSPAGSTAGNTGKMADAMDVMEDILEYMVDIAERETVNRFTTAEIHIDQTNNNSIASGMDLDGIMEQWNDDFTEILQVAAEGVHV